MVRVTANVLANKLTFFSGDFTGIEIAYCVNDSKRLLIHGLGIGGLRDAKPCELKNEEKTN